MSLTCNEHHECLENALRQAEEICQKNGSRLTDVRKRVLELVWSGHEPFKAYDLLTELQKNDAAAKPPTIYRALDFLREQGLIHKLHRLNAYIGCNHPKTSTPCLFLVCKNCNGVTESHDAAYQKLIGKVSHSHHFTPHAMSFEIEGICQACA